MPGLYLGILLVSLGGLTLADWRWRLAWFADAARTARTLALTVVVFLVWDLVGIQLGIFFPGLSQNTTGLLLAPGLPLEEPFFLWLLAYVTLLAFCYVERRWPRM